MSRALLVLLAALTCLACRQPAPVTEPPIPFTTDGCSDPSPSGRFKNPAYETACCLPHDRAYWRGGSETDRLKADQDLLVCVAAHGYPLDADLMYAAVRLGGGPERDTPYRWGYGWPYPHPYTPTSIGAK